MRFKKNNVLRVPVPPVTVISAHDKVGTWDLDWRGLRLFSFWDPSGQARTEYFRVRVRLGQARTRVISAPDTVGTWDLGLARTQSFQLLGPLGTSEDPVLSGSRTLGTSMDSIISARGTLGTVSSKILSLVIHLLGSEDLNVVLL